MVWSKLWDLRCWESGSLFMGVATFALFTFLRILTIGLLRYASKRQDVSLWTQTWPFEEHSEAFKLQTQSFSCKIASKSCKITSKSCKIALKSCKIASKSCRIASKSCRIAWKSCRIASKSCKTSWKILKKDANPAD